MPNSERGLPTSITSPIAWDAFDDLVHAADWRPIVTSRDPLTFDVEMDDAFTTILNGAPSWRARDQAQHWIANRIVQMVRQDFTKTTIRRASLQVRDDENGDDLIQGVKDRAIRNLRSEIHRHFDDSLQEWAREAFDHWGRMSDYGDQKRFRSYAGLDVVVSQDVMRKAVHYVLNRVPWTFREENGRYEFWGNHIADALRTRRYPPPDEVQLARALVMRAIEGQFEDFVARKRRDPDNTMVPTRFTFRDTVQQAFDQDGVWGVINLSLVRDRRRFRLEPPDMNDPRTEELLARLKPRLFVPMV
jgi:hypothetical protein